MLESTSRKTKMIVVGVIVVAALLMILLVPFISFNMVNPILENQLERIAQFQADENPKWHLLTLTTWLVSFFYPFWGTMSVLAGLTLLVIVKQVFDGEEWARGLALLCLSIPAMGGAYMIVPWMNFIWSKQGGFPPAVTIMMIGLIPYFSLLLAEKVDGKQRIVDGLVFLMLGVTGAESFANGHAAYRILFGHPKRPMFAEGIAITYFGWLGLWIGAALVIAAIYQLGARKEKGYYFALIGGVIVMVVSGATHYVRHATLDYLYGSLMGLSIVVMMLIPLFKKRLLNKFEE